MIDRIVVIRSPRQPERWSNFLERAPTSVREKAEAFDGIDGLAHRNNLPLAWLKYRQIHPVTKKRWHRLNWRAGVFGATMSHLAVIKNACDRFSGTIQIFEDDAEFSDFYEERLAQILDHMPGYWDMLWVGGRLDATEPTEIPWLHRAKRVLYLHSYIIHGSSLVKVRDMLGPLFTKKGAVTIDQWFATWHQRYLDCYVIAPPLVKQTQSKSGITGRTYIQPDYGKPFKRNT